MVDYVASYDGYPYASMNRVGFKNYPDFGVDDKQRGLHMANHCTLTQQTCFLTSSTQKTATASEVFKNVAFRVPTCGDCSTSTDYLLLRAVLIGSLRSNLRSNDAKRRNRNGSLPPSRKSQIPTKTQTSTRFLNNGVNHTSSSDREELGDTGFLVTSCCAAFGDVDSEAMGC